MDTPNSNLQTPAGTPHFDFNDLLEATSLEETNLAEGHEAEPARLRPVQEASIEDFEFGATSLPVQPTSAASTETVNASVFHLSNIDGLGFELEEAKAGVVSSEAKLRDEIIPAPRPFGTVRIKRSNVGGGRLGARRRGTTDAQPPEETAKAAPVSEAAAPIQPSKQSEPVAKSHPGTLHRHPATRATAHRGPAPKAAKATTKPAAKAAAKPAGMRPATGHDAILEGSVREALQTTGIAAVMRVVISVQKGGVSLTGELDSPTQKQMALDLTRGVRGVAKIHDMLTVARAEPVAPVAVAAAAPVAAPPGAASASEAEAKYAAAQTDANAARLAQFKAEQARQDQMRRAQSSRSSSSSGGRSFENPFKDVSIPGGWGTVVGVVVAGLAIWYFGFTGVPGSGRKKVPVYAVTGKVMFDGKPAAGATIRLVPKDKDTRNAIGSSMGNVEADGTFKLRTYAASGKAPDGAPNGDYMVTFFWFKPDDLEKEHNQLPSSYAGVTKFIAKVNGQTTLKTFELKSDGSGPDGVAAPAGPLPGKVVD